MDGYQPAELPPDGFHQGVEYSQEQINEALVSGKKLPMIDSNGHGTAVAAIAAGTGGVAPDSELLVVKLGIPGETGFPQNHGTDGGIGLCASKGTGIQDAGGSEYQFWKYLWISQGDQSSGNLF